MDIKTRIFKKGGALSGLSLLAVWVVTLWAQPQPSSDPSSEITVDQSYPQPSVTHSLRLSEASSEITVDDQSPSPSWVYFTDKGSTRSLESLQVGRVTAERRLASPIASLALLDDLALHPRYLRLLEVSGALIRARSRWLNAVSVEADSTLLPGLQALNIVRDIEPVAIQRAAIEPRFDTHGKLPIDTSHFDRTFTHLAMLNIPELHNMGVFGKGVKIGFLDSGFKRDHPVFKSTDVGGEHDFITGDDIMLYSSQSRVYTPAVSNFEIIRQPELHADWMFFIADSTPPVSPTGRLLFASRRSGNSWDEPVAVSEYHNAGPDGIVRSFAVTGTDDLLVVWEKGGRDLSNLGIRDLVWGILDSAGDFTKKSSTLDSNSRNPYLVTRADTSWLFYVKSDESVRLRQGVWDAGDVTWETASTVFSPGGVLERPQAVLFGDTVLVAALDLATGEFHLAQSINSGSSFTEISTPTDAEVVAFDLYRNYLITAEIDDATGAFELHFFMTADGGLSWSDYLYPASFPVIDYVRFAEHDGLLYLAFELAGQVYLTSQTGAGVIDSWEEHYPVSAEEFCYQPYPYSYGGNVEVVWSRRGDDDTDFDETEDGLDPNGRSQPSHGSRIAALLAGYESLKYVGAAPGAQLYAAKTEKHVNQAGSYYELRVEEDIWIEGLEWLERRGVDIVNSSLGYGDWYAYEERDGRHSPASRAATMAAERGVLVVSSAGNVLDYEHYILPPGDAEGILTVGGVDTLSPPVWWEQSSSADGSAVGPTADGRLKPELAAPALNVYVINVDYDTSFPSYYFYGRGTSYAAPLVAGSAALILELHPEYRGNPDTLIMLLEESAHQANSPDDTLGYGVPDAYTAAQPIPPGFVGYTRNELLPPYPNPYYPASQTRIYFPFRLNKGSPFVKIRIYTISGELVSLKELEPLTPNEVDAIGVGTYEEAADLTTMGAYWDGLVAETGEPAASGLYLVILHTEFGVHTTRFVLAR